MARFLGTFPASLTFSVSTTSLIGSMWIPALWGHIYNHKVTFMKRTVSRRTVARKSSLEKLCVCAGGFAFALRGAWHSKLTKVALIYNVSYFNLGGLGALFWGDKPTKAPWPRDWFHFTTNASQLVSGSVLGVFGSMVHWLVNSLSNTTQHVCDKVVLRTTRRGNAVSRNNFSCEVRERHHVCKNFGGGQLPGLPVPGW